MNYQIENKLNENSVLSLGFFDDEDSSHIHQYGLEAYLDTPLKPLKALKAVFYHHAQRPVLLINLGKKSKWSAKQLEKACHLTVSTLETIEHDAVDVCFPALEDDANKTLKTSILAFNQALYRFELCKSEKTSHPEHTISFLIDANEKALLEAKAISSGVHLACDLGNTPANICTPNYLVDVAKTLAKSHKKVKATIYDERQMKKMGMNTILSVSQGSQEEAYLIDLSYQNGGDSAPIVLVGKGITFDAGGTCLKPAKGMEEMKYDMCGAASVLGVMKALIELELPLNVHVLVPTSENLPGPTATKPGDVVTTYAKKTVEIINTDAEGRLVLCDALTYAEQFNPQSVIDIATLTGAIIVSLGHHTTGIMSNSDELCDELLNAGNKAHDKAWRLPIWEEYQEMLTSNVADLSNMGAPQGAGSITAACFLSKFAEKFPWAHLDIAGTAWKSGLNKAATGRPVPLLMQYLISKA